MSPISFRQLSEGFALRKCGVQFVNACGQRVETDLLGYGERAGFGHSACQATRLLPPSPWRYNQFQ